MWKNGGMHNLVRLNVNINLVTRMLHMPPLPFPYSFKKPPQDRRTDAGEGQGPGRLGRMSSPSLGVGRCVYPVKVC